MSVIVAIDFGEKRTGLAITDPLKIIASSLTTLKTTLVIDFLIEFSLKNDVEKFVIGLPKQKDNTESFIELKILVFIQKLKNSIPKVKIDRYDERYTSVIAKKTLINFNKKPYGLSKWIIEKRIRQISDAYILRVFGCYGSGDGSSVYRDRFKSICKHDGHITIDKDKYFDMIDVEDVRRVIHDYVCNIRCEKEIDLVYEKKMLLSG